jgi:hypothetical protein
MNGANEALTSVALSVINQLKFQVQKRRPGDSRSSFLYLNEDSIIGRKQAVRRNAR